MFATVTYAVQFGSPGMPGRGFPVTSGPGGDVVLRLRLRRPLRQRIDGEAGMGDWVDVGGLTYAVGPLVPRRRRSCAPTTACPSQAPS